MSVPPKSAEDTSKPDDSTESSAAKRPARKILPSDYTHVRWILGKPLAPKATALLRFRATFT